jgi:DUF1680 family protein
MYLVDTSRSPHTRLRPVPLEAVRLMDTFWLPRQRQNIDTILPYQYDVCEQTGRIDNFRRASGKIQQDFQGYFFNDSDVYKWLEAAAWTLATDPTLMERVDAVIDEIAAAQEPDGYLNTYFTFDKKAERWSNLSQFHELYCAGHLIQAAVAHKRATGSDRLLDIARRFADLIGDTFGPAASGKREGTDGHPEIEMALVELYRLTGEQKYLDQAGYFVDARGRGLLGGGEYFQDEVPFRQRTKLAGHAVRALYLCCGAADLYSETGEAALLESLDRQWAHMVARQIYVNGGLGARPQGEAFGDDYELPNFGGYGETCAAIASVMWNWRMLQITGDAHYADLMEHTLYNAVLPGISLDGKHYFYTNPMADDGAHRRQPWFACACCPTNIIRLLATVQGYFYSTSDDGIYVHLYGANEATLPLPDGRTVTLRQRTEYPWDNFVNIEILDAPSNEFSLFLHIPSWSSEVAIDYQVVAAQSIPANGYVELHRRWQTGDRIQLVFKEAAYTLEAHPSLSENQGKLAFMRGPVLYCIEGVDNSNIDQLTFTGNVTGLGTRHNSLGDIEPMGLEVSPSHEVPPWSEQLYRPRRSTGEVKHVPVLAIPYFAWGNREPGQMRVWLRSR